MLIKFFVCTLSLLIGCLCQILINKLIKSSFGKPLLIGATAFIFSSGLCSFALIYLSAIDIGSRPWMVISFTIGIGLIRWIKKEL